LIYPSIQVWGIPDPTFRTASTLHTPQLSDICKARSHLHHSPTG